MSQSSRRAGLAKTLVIALGIFLLLLGIDQYSKYWAVAHLKNQDAISLISGVFELHYLENHGAAWGILSGKMFFLIGISVLVLGLLVYLYTKIPEGRHFWLLKACFLCIFAGTVGNLLDRVFHQYVIDFLYFKWIDFPVFNVADIYVTLGAGLLIVALFFVYSEQELSFWKFFREK